MSARLKIAKSGTIEEVKGNWILMESVRKSVQNSTLFLVKCPEKNEFGLFIYGKIIRVTRNGIQCESFELLWCFLIKVIFVQCILWIVCTVCTVNIDSFSYVTQKKF